MCTVTKSVHPDVGHYWPFAINNTVTHRDHLRENLLRNTLVLSDDLKEKLVGLLAPSNGELGASDKSWNMISFNTQLHRYWDKAYFGLKWMGVVGTSETDVVGLEGASEMKATEARKEYESFRVQWHWLPDRIPDALQSHLIRPEGERCDARSLVDLDSEEALHSVKSSLRTAITQQRSLFSTKGAMARDENGRIIESGRELILKVEAKDLDKIKTIIEAQWLAIQMAALSGAAEMADDLDKRPAPCFPDTSLGLTIMGTMEPIERVVDETTSAQPPPDREEG